LLFLNSGSDRVLALSADGIVVRDTGQMEGLNPVVKFRAGRSLFRRLAKQGHRDGVCAST
jgi:hypothetical protein